MNRFIFLPLEHRLTFSKHTEQVLLFWGPSIVSRGHTKLFPPSHVTPFTVSTPTVLLRPEFQGRFSVLEIGQRDLWVTSRGGVLKISGATLLA